MESQPMAIPLTWQKPQMKNMWFLNCTYPRPLPLPPTPSPSPSTWIRLCHAYLNNLVVLSIVEYLNVWKILCPFSGNWWNLSGSNIFWCFPEIEHFQICRINSHIYWMIQTLVRIWYGLQTPVSRVCTVQHSYVRIEVLGYDSMECNVL